MKAPVLKEVIVSKAASRKVSRFFPWVYDNEIVEPPRNIGQGELVKVVSAEGGLLGIGYINPASAIAIRILSFTERSIDESFLKEKISRAWERRRKLMASTNAFRVVHSEADDLPGLVVDYYDGCLALQINTAGMENFRSWIISALVDVIGPRGIYERSELRSREKEGLGTDEGVLCGEIPEAMIIEENGVRFCVKLRESQKTGFYLDQRRNRQVVASHVGEGFRVLDVFSNTGGFGIYAACRTAGAVTLVDRSAPALELAGENIRLNNLKNVSAVRDDAFDYLDGAFKKGSRYDLVVLDPPSFTKTKGAKAGALKGYRRLVFGGLRILSPEGCLALFSCSHHVSLDDLKSVTLDAAEEADCRLEVLAHLFQDIDHPYIINIPQSLYLKGLLCRKSRP